MIVLSPGAVERALYRAAKRDYALRLDKLRSNPNADQDKVERERARLLDRGYLRGLSDGYR